MFISLTASDNGQAVDIRADEVQGVQVLDRANTHLFLRGGTDIVVRESPARIKAAVSTVMGWGTVGPRATQYEGGRW
jgi:hypothetical protein